MVNVYLIQAHVTENRKKSEVSENSKVEQIFKSNELQEGKVMLIKVNINKITSRSNMFKAKCKSKDLNYVFRFTFIFK